MNSVNNSASLLTLAQVARWQRVKRLRIDATLAESWHQHGLDRVEHLSLLALGGYGRGELYPHSDIDISVVHRHKLSQKQEDSIAAFIRSLWDRGWDLGHNLLSYEQAQELAAQDLNFLTALLEARLLQGSSWNYARLQSYARSDAAFGAAKFFEAKIEERNQRWTKFYASAHTLEPNLKNSPGNLRDLHTLQWLGQKYFYSTDLKSIAHLGYLSQREWYRLRQCWRLLSWMRVAVQSLAGRADDRLLLERQQQLAEQRGQSRQELMQQYYRSVASVRALSLLLIEDWRGTIFGVRETRVPRVLRLATAGLIVRRGCLDFADQGTLRAKPELMLQVFEASLERDRDLSTNAIRLIYNHRYLVDGAFRSQPGNQASFLRIMAQPAAQLTPALRTMRRCALLPAYLPAFKRVEGALQYDLFHQYSVDAHSLRLFDKLAALAGTAPKDLAAACYQDIEDKLPLHLAMLFHDLGKGRGGEHELVGARLLQSFSRRHSLTPGQSRLAVWLVREHLQLSHYAQKSDLEDPRQLHGFIELTQANRAALKNLLVLTVVDIQATNDQLWSSWRQHMIYGFYRAVDRYLAGGEEARDGQQRLEGKYQRLLRACAELGGDQLQELWGQMPREYRRAQSVATLAAHVRTIANGAGWHLRKLPKVKQHYEFFIHQPDSDYTFARIAAALARRRLTIIKAVIHSDELGWIWDSFIVHSEHELAEQQLQEVGQSLVAALGAEQLSEPRLGALPRTSKGFRTRCELTPSGQHSLLKLTTADRSSLLAWLAYQLSQEGVSIVKAHCNTMGARVEDQLQLHQSQRPLSQKSSERILQKLSVRLDS